ncbi:MAG: hypothetical protein RLP45_16710, partial [Haliea sp.]
MGAKSGANIRLPVKKWPPGVASRESLPKNTWHPIVSAPALALTVVTVVQTGNGIRQFKGAVMLTITPTAVLGRSQSQDLEVFAVIDG